jgi:hypothetical protein
MSSEHKCEQNLVGTIDWTGSLTGYQRCGVCGKMKPVVVADVQCNRKVQQCGYRLPDGVCVPISRYGKSFDCTVKR